MFLLVNWLLMPCRFFSSAMCETLYLEKVFHQDEKKVSYIVKKLFHLDEKSFPSCKNLVEMQIFDIQG